MKIRRLVFILSLSIFFPIHCYSTPIVFDVNGYEYNFSNGNECSFDGYVVIDDLQQSYTSYTYDPGGIGTWNILSFDITIDGLNLTGDGGRLYLSTFDNQINLIGNGGNDIWTLYMGDLPANFVPITEDYCLGVQPEMLQFDGCMIDGYGGGLFELTLNTEPIPEPATFLLLSSGFLIMINFKKKRTYLQK